MIVTHTLSLLSASMRAALVLTALIGTASLATRLAFTTGALQARVDEAIRRAPAPSSFDQQIHMANMIRLPSHQR
jgi:hypothetical protein